MTKTIPKDRITEIIESSENMFVALLKLYKEVLSPVLWDDIESMNPSDVHVNMKTGSFIIDEFKRVFSSEDTMTIHFLILDKGFSAHHQDLNDWEVRITDGAYVLKDPINKM